MSNSSSVSRRNLLKGAGIAAGTLLIAGAPATGLAGNTRPATPMRRGRGVPKANVDPFTLGVASGEPLPDSVVIWTRLARDPLARNGGMPDHPIPVHWEVAEDERFRHVTHRWTTLARPEEGHSVHVNVTGLEPHREYHYRFRSGMHISPVGRTRTAPAPGTSPAVLMAFASCAQYEHGYFTSYRRLADEQCDVIFHLGDYIYEYGPNEYVLPEGNVRDHVGPQIRTLGDYRRRHAQYKTDPDLQAAHASAPFVVAWDDHEIDNNHAAGIPENEKPEEGNDTPEHFAARRAAAYKAYWENMPLRRFRKPVDTTMPLYRRLRFGDIATFNVLDTRQYRTDQPCDDEFGASCGGELDPSATILGEEQASWLEHGLATSTATWQVIPQQVPMMAMDSEVGPDTGGYNDAWDGYRASRDRLLSFVANNDVENFVVLTGDVHASYMSDLRVDFEDESSAVIGSEFIGTSIASAGDGDDVTTPDEPLEAENPHIRYYRRRRGYVRCMLDASTFQADYRIVDYVSTPGAPIKTDKSYVIEAGNPQANDA